MCEIGREEAALQSQEFDELGARIAGADSIDANVG
jgi:hypothetical protein